MIAEHKGEIPVVILLLPFMAGIGCGLYSFSGNIAWLAAGLVALGLLFIAFNLGYTRLQIYKARWAGGLLIYPILFLAGWLLTLQRYELKNADHFAKQPAQYLIVNINSEPKVKADIVRFTATVTQTITKGKTERTSGIILVTIKDQLARNLFYGEQLLIPGKYAEVDPPFNPGEFNYKQYLAHQNVYHQAFLYPKQYKIIKAGYGNPAIAFALQMRQTLVKKLYANLQDTTAIAVASTLILGYKADLSNDVLQAYSKTGTIHILSVSGGHVAIIYGLLALLLGFMDGWRRGKMLKAIIIILLIWAYTMLTGFSPAACRAALMISLFIGGKTFVRFTNSLNILACSAFVLLLYDPFLLADVGFQLSFTAVAGLIIFQPIVYAWFEFKNKFGDYLWKACSVSMSAQVITFPLAAFYFHQFPVYFLVSNLLIIAPVMLIMIAGGLLLILPQLDSVSKPIGYVLEHTILLMNKALTYIEHAPYASINKIWLTRLEHGLLYAIIIAFFYLFFDSKKKWLLPVALGATLLFCISISYKKFRANEMQTVTFLSLRKHMGIVFKNGSDGVVITDLPETDKNFQYAIQPGLDSMRITNYKVYTTDQEIHSPFLLKQGDYLQFLNKRMLLLNQRSGLQSIPKQMRIDYIYLSGNPILTPKNIDNQLFIADATNSDQYIAKLKNIPVNCKTLKRNKSIPLSSKE